MPFGKMGANKYWFDQPDARKACEETMAGAFFGGYGRRHAPALLRFRRRKNVGDSDWIATNTRKVVAAQNLEKKPGTSTDPDLVKYRAIQNRSLHHGPNGEWNTGSKKTTDDAKVVQDFERTWRLWPDSLDLVKGMLSSVGAQVLKIGPKRAGTKFHYKTKKDVAPLKIAMASVVFV